jgi:hypothetical protein
MRDGDADKSGPGKRYEGEGAGRLAQTETLESSGIIAGYWFLVSGL